VEDAIHAILVQREQRAADRKAGGGERLRAKANTPLATLIAERAEAERRRDAFRRFVGGLSLSERAALLVIDEHDFYDEIADVVLDPAPQHARTMDGGDDAIASRFNDDIFYIEDLPEEELESWPGQSVAEELLDGYALACEHGVDGDLAEAMIAADEATAPLETEPTG
jgi:hypothetical protein